MTRRTIDPDVTRHDDGAYWAAALMVAIQARDAERQALARDHLRRLGYRVDVVRGPKAAAVAVEASP